MVHHIFNRLDGHAVANRIAQIHDKDRHPHRFFGDLIQRRCAGQQDHKIGMLHAADPNLLSVDHISVTLANGSCFNLGRIRTRCGFGHPHRLQT